MKDKVFRFKLFFTGFIFIIDLISVRALYKFTEVINTNILPVLILHAFIFLIFFSFIVLVNPLKLQRHPVIVANILRFTGAFSLIYFPKIVWVIFSVIEDIFMFILTASGIEIFPPYVISYSGFILSVILILFLLYGMLIGRFRYKIYHVRIPVRNLPLPLENLRIIHLSDIHIGSFYRFRKQIRKAIHRINALQPDLILFSGDMVNNFSEEINGWEQEFKQLHSVYGKYAVLGNHDYGDYYTWTSDEEKNRNKKILFRFFKETGFHLLMNETIQVKTRDSKLNIIGVENWGSPPFKQYGNLKRALENQLPSGIKILLSHDPSHWDAEVLNKTDIDVTLSGHTHGMQLGIRLGRYEWSPSGWLYKRWGGLYCENGQSLYVNRGMGFIGLPMRIGILPEIACLQLIHVSSDEKTGG